MSVFGYCILSGVFGSFCFLGGWGFQLLWFEMWAFEDLSCFELYHLGSLGFQKFGF